MSSGDKPMTRSQAVLIATYLTIAMCRQVRRDLATLWHLVRNR